MSEEERGYAKLNLALHVRAREADGYHRIETLFAFCEDGDGLTRGAADGPPLSIEGPFAAGLAAGADNLVARAAAGLGAHFGFTPPALRLIKRLPVAAGIGGGSADAAAALRLLCRQQRIDVDEPAVMALAAALGADVPACLHSIAVRGDGRGDRLHPMATHGLGGRPVLLINPRVPLATGAVFAGWDGVDRGPLAAGDPFDAAIAGRNDLEPAAIRLVPKVGELLGELRRCAGAVLARMSGSGATCFGLFDDTASRDAAAARLARALPGCWQLATRLRG